MTYGAALTALTHARRGRAGDQRHDPRGPRRAARRRRSSRAGGAEGQLPRRHAALGQGSTRATTARRARRTLEGFLFPATYELRQPARPPRRSSTASSTRSRTNFAQVEHAPRAGANLSRYDVLIIASMIEREAQVPRDRRADRGGHLQPPQAGHPARHRRDAALRARTNWTAPLRGLRAQQRLAAYNTRTRHGLPPTPIGNPGLASIQAAAHPANVPYLFYVVKPCGERRARVLLDRRAVPAATSPPTTQRASAGGNGPASTADARAEHASASSAGRSPTAARRRCTTPRSRRPGLDGDWRYQRLPVAARAVRRDRARAGRRRLPRRQRHDPAQGGRARARRRAPPTRARDRRGEHADVRPTAARSRRQHRRPGPARRARRRPRRARALVLGAGGSARAVVWALRAPARRRGLEPHARSAPRRSPPSSASRAVDGARAADLLVNCTSVGLHDPAATFKELP